MPLHLFVGLRVRDFQAALPWYEQLLGEPTFCPHATEAVWTLAEDRSVNVVEHADGAGDTVVTAFLDDLDAHVVAAGGLEPDERVTLSNGVRKLLYHDPDGNELDSAARRSTPVHMELDRQGGAAPFASMRQRRCSSCLRSGARTRRGRT